MPRQPDHVWDGDDDRRRIIYVHSNGHSRWVEWLMGIAAVIVTSAILWSAASQVATAKTLVLVLYRLDRIEQAINP